MPENNLGVIIIKNSGLGTSKRNIKATHIWSDDMGANGEIMFLGDSVGSMLEYVVDIEYAINGAVVVNTYDFNAADVEAIATSEEGKIALHFMIEKLTEKYKENKRSYFTISLKDYREIEEKDFGRYSQSYNVRKKHDLFIFRGCTNPALAFPVIHMIEYKNDTDYTELFPVQLWMSHWIFPPVSKPTDFGKFLTYLLVRSQVETNLVKRAPAVKNVSFPTLPTAEIPSFYRTEALEKLAIASGVDKLKRIGDKTVNTAEDADTIIVPEVVPDNEPYGQVDGKSIELKMIREAVDKEEIALSDVLTYGVAQTVKMFHMKNALRVSTDIAGMAKKMCIFEGFIYAIPYPSDESLNNLNEELGEYLVVCTEESFPLNAKKS